MGQSCNTNSGCPSRGAGRPEALFIIERMVDILARKLGMDPAELRRKNLIPADKFPYQTALGLVYDSGNYERAMRKALDIVAYEQLRQEQGQARQEGRRMGIRLSTHVGGCGLAPPPVS